mmetsp:Transcript_53525/g.121761  ORF Transcript_53525/g.121761 Transcript_53525/m.121761 type:complete len:294 (+) Transcript_53525:1600-2481(+)
MQIVVLLSGHHGLRKLLGFLELVVFILDHGFCICFLLVQPLVVGLQQVHLLSKRLHFLMGRVVVPHDDHVVLVHLLSLVLRLQATVQKLSPLCCQLVHGGRLLLRQPLQLLEPSSGSGSDVLEVGGGLADQGDRLGLDHLHPPFDCIGSIHGRSEILHHRVMLAFHRKEHSTVAGKNVNNLQQSLGKNFQTSRTRRRVQQSPCFQLLFDPAQQLITTFGSAGGWPQGWPRRRRRLQPPRSLATRLSCSCAPAKISLLGQDLHWQAILLLRDHPVCWTEGTERQLLHSTIWRSW